MPSTPSLVSRLITDFPDLHFSVGSTTLWEPSTKTIRYHPQYEAAELLHELGHALLGHSDYRRDIVLLGYERDAWQEALRLSSQYDVVIDQATVQSHLDTYRDWLHTRSACPACQANGVQLSVSVYQCLSCHTKWKVNEARTAALRRQTIK